MLSRSRTFYINDEVKPPYQKKSFEYKGYKNNFQPIKNSQIKDTQVILENIFFFIDVLTEVIKTETIISNY